MKINLFSISSMLFLSAMTMGCGSHDHSEDVHDDENHSHDVETLAEEKDHVHGEDEILMTPEQAKAAGVIVEKVERGDFSEVIPVTGSILPAPESETTISATMTGIVKLSDNRITEGGKVKAGQTLFQISTQTLGDGNPVAAAQAELDAATKEWERAQQLIGDKIISDREYEAARLRYETAKSTSESMGNGQKNRSITSPMAGYLQSLLVKNGDYVTAGQALAIVTQNQKLQLRADVPERYYASLNRISSANFCLTYAADQIFELNELNGRLLSTGRTATKGDGFVPVTFEFDNIGNIIPGSLAEIYLLGQVQHDVITVPTTALTEEMGLFYVYLQTSDHGYEKREVVKGANNGQRIKIVKGLQPGEQVVVRGAVAVKLAASSNMIPDAHAGHSH